MYCNSANIVFLKNAFVKTTGKRLSLSIIFLLLIGLCFSQKKVKNISYDFSTIDHTIQSWLDSGYYKGASLIIVKDNHRIYRNYFGNYTPETVAYIASAGKWLAAATIAAVVEEGKLSWNDPVKKWLPEFKDVKGDATLLQLLSHTAGYPDYQPKDNPVDIYQTLQESVVHIIDLPADTLPGTKFKYGGLAMQVAGRMAELATGKDWETIFQQKMAIPLSMVATHFTPVDSAGGHAPMLGGGARTTLNEYANFLSMINNSGVFKGKHILTDASIKIMQADQVGNAKVNAGEFVEKSRATFRKDIYGLGEWREEVNVNGEAVLISSPSWAGAYAWIDKVNHVYGFFLAHVANMKKGFSSFYASPVLPILVRDVLKDASHREVKRGYIRTKDGASLFYEELGTGEPLIFIHGHSFDHYEWDPQFYEFAKKYRVIRYDVRGYGRSSMPAEFSSSSHAEDLFQLINALKLNKVHLVGLSMGGFIATDFLALHQNRLLSVTLASGDVWAGSPGPEIPWNDDEMAKRRLEIEAYKSKGIFNNKVEWLNALTIRKGKVLEQIREPIWNMIYKWDAWQPLHIEPRFLLGVSAIDKLKQQKIKVPILVLTGAIDAGNKNKLMELVPSAKQVFVPGAGHVSNLENAEGFNKALGQFLPLH